MTITVRRVVGVLASAVLAAAGLTAATAPAQAAAPTGGYVSIGDSLAFGYQQVLFDDHATAADYVGFAEDYAAMKDLPLANFACPGETSDSLIHGGCGYHLAGFPMHMAYSGAQLDAALAYLAGHPDTSLVTVDIGSNDLLQAIDLCRPTPDLMGCLSQSLPAVLNNLVNNYAYVLGHVHAVAPGARLVVMGLYNPLALSLPGTDALLTQIVNPTLAQMAAAVGAALHTQIAVADVFSRMNGHEGSPAETAFVCSRTWMCRYNPPDIHATPLGYQQMAVALLQSLR